MDLYLDGLFSLQIRHQASSPVTPENDIVCVVGIVDSSKLAFYHLSAKTGEIVKDFQESLHSGLSSEIVFGSDNLLVAHG
jgi:ER membrane protein complex subunit 1